MKDKKVKRIILMVLLIACIFFGIGTIIVKNKQREAEKNFNEFNEQLVYDIYNFSPERTNEEKRAGLKTRMDQKLMDEMCPPLPELNKDPNLPVNTLINVKTEELNKSTKAEKIVTTRFVIKTPEGKEYPQRVQAEYQKSNNEWLLMKIQPI